MPHSHIRLTAVLVVLSAVVVIQSRSHAAPAAVAYTAEGYVPVPDYSKWVFIGSGAFQTTEAPAPRFSNVFVAPDVYDAFVRTGTWPDGTVIFSEKRAGVSTLPITANQGWGQTGEPVGFEFEVKDLAHGGWRYFTAPAGAGAGKPVAKQSDCTTCHAEHGAVDNTFVQFYPKLAAFAKAHHTFRAHP
jgi:hypothetical protein